ncbi:MAG: hypothetical protein HYY61_04520 [Deltaproteobacteria bacterium]|nr:hypothetical protein [Deltaproteobacteria bacterium]
MKSSFTLFQRTFASFLAILFTFVMVSNNFPHSAYAQATSLLPLPSEAKLRDEILMGGKAIELMSQRLLQEYEIQKPKFPLEGEKPLPGVQEGAYCRQCHSDALSSSPSAPSSFPLHVPDFLNDPFFLTSRGGNSHWHSHSPEKKFALLDTNMRDLKTKVEQYVLLENAPIEFQITLIKVYLGALIQYLVTSLRTFPLSNPFDALDDTWHLRFPLSKIDQIKATVSKPETFQSTRETFATLIYFKDDRMFFSDTFKIAIELSSFLREQNEDAWLNILKLQTVQFLGRQLLKINSYWPETSSENKEFFGKLSSHFRSLNHSFGSMLQDQEQQRQTNFNQFLGDHLSTQDIPTLITLERYQELMSHAPRMWDALGSRFEEYFEKSSWITIEKEATKTEIKKALYLHPFSISEYEPQELAMWIKTRILEIKKKFFHDHLEYHFLNPKEMTPSDAESLEQKYLSDYEKELTPGIILQWLATFDSSAPAAVKSAVEFLKFSAQVEGATEQIAQIDEQIQALLLHDFNKHISWGHTLLPGRQIDQSWRDSEMDQEEMNAMVPYPPDSSIPDLMPIEKFPQIKPIEMNPINFGIVLATLISSIENNLFLIKHIEKFTKASTKEELLQNYTSLVGQVQKMVSNTPHEREKLKETLTVLEKLGEKIKRLNPKNTETLDDFFATSKEKVEFLKTKRAIMTNVLRILDIPMESGTGNVNQERKEKIYLHHIQDLNKQDGVLLSEVREFLASSMDAAETFSLLQTSDFRYDKFQEAYPKKVQVFLKTPDTQKALEENTAILKELRHLENELRSFHAGYVHPEYFIETKGNLLSPQTLEKLKRVQDLRNQRKTVYLDKGGSDLDEWLKGYLGTFMLRQALVAQDLLIRKNIDKVVHARSIDEAKEFILDSFILDQALELVKQEYPAQEWRVTAFRKMHTHMIGELSDGLLDTYFDSSWHSAMFWSLVTLQIILYFIPGAQLGAVAIGVFLLGDALIQTGHHLLVKTPRSYHIIQNKEDFYLSSAIPEEIIAAGGAGPGGSNYGDFKKMSDDVFWEAVITGGVSVLLLPWAKFEAKRALQLFHTKTNWFVSLKIPLYAKNLGIETGTPLTLPLVREKMAQRLGFPTQEFLNLETPKLVELTMAKLGKEEGAKFLQMVQFFNQKNIAQHLWITELVNYHRALKKEFQRWSKYKHELKRCYARML